MKYIGTIRYVPVLNASSGCSSTPAVLAAGAATAAAAARLPASTLSRTAGARTRSVIEERGPPLLAPLFQKRYPCCAYLLCCQDISIVVVICS